MQKDRYYKNIKVNDKVEILDICGDDDLLMWCEKFGYIQKIVEIEQESELVWVDKCPYAIEMRNIILL